MSPPSDATLASPLDLALRAARRQRTRRLLLLSGAALAALAAVAVFVIASRGVRLLITPAEAAEQASIELLDGLGLSLGGRVYTFSSQLHARLEAPGFFPEELAVTPEPGSNYVEVTLRERPAQLQLSTAPASAQTRWRLDEEILGDAAGLTLSVAPGTHTLRVDSPFHREVEQSLTLTRAEERALQIALQPIAGEMSIDSQPAGADVLVDGDLRGQTPLTLAVPGGEYLLEVRQARHAEVVERARITRDRPTLTRNYRLLPNPATLRLSATPGGGTLIVDGTRRTLDSAPLRLASGVAHTVVYSLPGHTTTSDTITLAADETRQLELRLDTLFGDVRIEAEPAADVFVDGAMQGSTPLILELQAVDHRIELRREGYATVTRTVRPSPEAPQLVAATMLTLEEAKSQAAPPRYRSTAGLSMQRFDPTGTFTMGAPADERGQRANEHLREVRLTRPFYVSRTEVSRGQFSQFEPAPSTGNANLPVTGVSWNDAARYCNWLSDREGLTRVYRFAGARYLGADLAGDGYRLPTEAEWEWLARAAGRRQSARFTWGSEYQVPEQAGNFADETAAKDSSVSGELQFYLPRYTDGFARLAPVGSFPPHRSGLQDLSGNVREWAHDYYDLNPPTNRVGLDPTGPRQGTSEGHVIKGSGWRDGRVETLRAAHRGAGNAGSDDLGFRVARYIY